MARYTLKKHAAADTVKWVIIFLLMIGVIGAIVTLFVILDRNTTVTEIGAEQYIIGGLDDEGAAAEGDTSIVTRGTFTTDGLKVELTDEATVTYELYFYDGEDNFISSTGALSADFSGSIPDGAESAGKTLEPKELPALGHDLIYYAAVEPAEGSEGNIEYWQCERCEKYFSDKDGTNEISYSDISIPYMSDSTDTDTDTDGMPLWQILLVVGSGILLLGVVAVLLDKFVFNADISGGK